MSSSQGAQELCRYIDCVGRRRCQPVGRLVPIARFSLIFSAFAADEDGWLPLGRANSPITIAPPAPYMPGVLNVPGFVDIPRDAMARYGNWKSPSPSGTVPSNPFGGGGAGQVSQADIDPGPSNDSIDMFYCPNYKRFDEANGATNQDKWAGRGLGGVGSGNQQGYVDYCLFVAHGAPATDVIRDEYTVNHTDKKYGRYVMAPYRIELQRKPSQETWSADANFHRGGPVEPHQIGFVPHVDASQRVFADGHTISEPLEEIKVRIVYGFFWTYYW